MFEFYKLLQLCLLLFFLLIPPLMFSCHNHSQGCFICNKLFSYDYFTQKHPTGKVPLKATEISSVSGFDFRAMPFFLVSSSKGIFSGN